MASQKKQYLCDWCGTKMDWDDKYSEPCEFSGADHKLVCGIDGCTRPAGPGPEHEPLSTCKSGKRPHCTCDYCF